MQRSEERQEKHLVDLVLEEEQAHSIKWGRCYPHCTVDSDALWQIWTFRHNEAEMNPPWLAIVRK